MYYNTFNEFYDKKGELISGIVQKSDDVSIIVDLGKLEGIILPTELLPGESYNYQYSDSGTPRFTPRA